MKKIQTLLLIAALATMAAACSSSTASSGGTKDTASTTDTTAGSDTTLPGDTTTATDTTTTDTVKTDVTTTDTAKTDTAGDTAATFLCTYATPTADPGCSGTADQAAIAKLKADTKLSDAFAQAVADCTLQSGCLAQGSDCADDQGTSNAQGQCIAACVLKKTNNLVTNNCAWCYGEYSGVCGFHKCLSECAAAPSSKGCSDCLAANCDPLADACKAGK